MHSTSMGMAATPRCPGPKGLLSSLDATGWTDRQTVPIAELVQLGHYPEIPVDLRLSS